MQVRARQEMKTGNVGRNTRQAARFNESAISLLCAAAARMHTQPTATATPSYKGQYDQQKAINATLEEENVSLQAKLLSCERELKASVREKNMAQLKADKLASVMRVREEKYVRLQLRLLDNIEQMHVLVSAIQAHRTTNATLRSAHIAAYGFDSR